MKEEKSPRSTAALTMFLLFAAVLFGLTPAEASIPRAGVAEDGPPLLALHELAPSAIAPSRFGFVQSVWLLDVESAPGCFGLFGLETRRCERTYARNNPLKYVDPDGRDIWDKIAGASSAFLSDVTWGLLGRPEIDNADFRAGQQFGDQAALALAIQQFTQGIGTSGGALALAPETGGVSLVAVGAGGAQAVWAVTTGLIAGQNLMNSSQGGSDSSKSANRVSSPNQMNREIQTGKAPEDIKRVDVGKVKNKQTHVHFKDGSALNQDGTWKHGERALRRVEADWLQKHGWNLP